MKNKVFIIAGPTSSGKTSLALQLTKEIHAEIISADSRQIYKYMDVGTGKIPVNSSNMKISKEEGMWRIDETNVWGYDLVEPGKYFSSYDFAKYSLEKIHNITSQGKTTFIVGGTGFYIDTLTGRTTVSEKGVDTDLREELSKLPLYTLQNKLKEINAEVFSKTDVNNPIRLIRAIERETSNTTSLTLPHLKNTEFVYLGLTAPREVLYQKVDNWVEEIWRGGVIEEVKKLIEMGYKDTPQLHGLVYKSVLDYLSGEQKEADAKQKIKFDLHAYIRRQQTWFKRNQEIKWLDITGENLSENALSIVKSYIDG